MGPSGSKHSLEGCLLEEDADISVSLPLSLFSLNELSMWTPLCIYAFMVSLTVPKWWGQPTMDWNSWNEPNKSFFHLSLLIKGFCHSSRSLTIIIVTCDSRYRLQFICNSILRTVLWLPYAGVLNGLAAHMIELLSLSSTWTHFISIIY